MTVVITFLLALLLPSIRQEPALTVELVGNAGVLLSDGATSLLIDLPYESGAFGYMRYDASALQPMGTVVSVITHHHLDHFDARLFLARNGWRVIGPPSVTRTLPPERVLAGDSMDVGAFAVIAVATPHTPDHRSYRVRWRGRVLYFTGDTEAASAVPAAPRIDVLFVTPWLNCTLETAGSARPWERRVLYHVQPDGSDRVCGSVERMRQGARFTLPPDPARRD